MEKSILIIAVSSRLESIHKPHLTHEKMSVTQLIIGRGCTIGHPNNHATWMVQTIMI